MNEDKVTLEVLEEWCDEITRKHLREAGYRVFKHPTYASACIMVKDGEILGMTSHSILRDNASTSRILSDKDFMSFKY